ncbi:MerR family transcriptional regulator, partial [candidate division WWE3 bacterium]|nr:MerR family transcriptional regulator [candidate division WWE3 bacterium]
MPIQNNEEKTYSIAKISDLLHVTKTVIRNWETEYNLNIKRGVNGYRKYTNKDLEDFQKILSLRKNARAVIGTQIRSGDIGGMKDSSLNKITNLQNSLQTNPIKTTKRKLSTAITISLIAGVIATLLSPNNFELNTSGLNSTGWDMIKLLTFKNTETFIKQDTVLGERDRKADYILRVNTPTSLKNLEVLGDATFDGNITTGAIALTGRGNLSGVAALDTTTVTTFATNLNLSGDIIGNLVTTSIADGVITGDNFSSDVTYDGTFDITG